MDQESEAAFEEFVRASYSRLLRLAYLLCADRGHAEDVVQTTLAKMALAWPRLLRSTGADHYAQRVLVNTVTTRRRRLWRGETPTADVDAVGDGDPYHQLDQRDALRRALAALPARQRTAVVLRHYADLSEYQAAELMGCSVGTVKSLTSRGLHKLRECLDMVDEPQRIVLTK